MYYCTMLLAVLLALVLVDRCHCAILWQPKSNSPCAENSVGPSNTENTSTEYDGHQSPILNGRHRNIVMPQMHLKPSATILYKPTIFNTRKRNAPDTDIYNLHRNTYSSKLSTFAKWLVNKQQLQRKLNEANVAVKDKPRHQHDKRYVKCEYTKSMPVRHARAIDLRDERTRPVNKRHTAVSDLTLCHFKICNMGRKRTTRYFHMIDELAHDN